MSIVYDLLFLILFPGKPWYFLYYKHSIGMACEYEREFQCQHTILADGIYLFSSFLLLLLTLFIIFALEKKFR